MSQAPLLGGASAPSAPPVKPRRLQHTLLHTRVTLDFSDAFPSSRSLSTLSSRVIHGVCELVYQPLTDKLRFVTFCCRGYSIDAVTVDGVSASWSVVNSSLFPSLQALSCVRDVRCLELVFDDEADCALSGNVWVKLPKRVKEAMKEREKAKRSANQEVDITGDSGAEEDRPVPVVVAVAFRVEAACKGLEWWTATSGGVAGEDVCLTVTGLGDASLWMPCMDAPSERSSVELQLVLPAHLTAVASGRLTERRYADDARTKVCFVFKQERPIPSSSVGWAVGRFTLDVDERLDWVSCLFPSSAQAAFSYSVTAPSTLSSIVRLLEAHLGQFPFPYLHLVFCSTRVGQVFAGLLLLPVDWLTDGRLIDPVYSHRRHLAYQVARCWLSALVLEAPCDEWIVMGLSGVLSLSFVERTLGRSEADWLALRWSCEVAREDGEVGLSVSVTSQLLAKPLYDLPTVLKPEERATDSLPLCWSGYTHPAEVVSRTSRRKAAVVMLMLQAKTGHDTFQQITRRLMEEHSERGATAPSTTGGGGAGAGGMAGEGAAAVLPLSTVRFSELVKEVSADADLSSFFTQWLWSDGYPRLEVEFKYSAKKKNTSVLVLQRQFDYRPGLRFEGSCKFAIHESERVTEQERRVETAKHDFEFSCVSRVRRNRKRKHYDKDALLHLPLEKLLTRHNDTPVLWVRCDVLHAFFQPVDVYANEVMLCSQLQGEREVRGQMEAIIALWRLFLAPDRPLLEDDLRVHSVEDEGLHLSLDALRDAFHDQRFYYRVRLLAARALARAATTDASESSSRQLLEDWFRGAFADAHSGEWKANDWSDVGLYFMKKGLALELSCAYVRHGDTELSPGRTVRLLVSLLSEHEHERNAYADDHYIADLLHALGNLRLSAEETQTRTTVVGLLQRHLDHDQVLPSYQRVVTQAALSAGVVFQLNNQLAEHILPYANYLDSVFPADVRLAAFRCVLLLCNQQPHRAKLFPHLLAALSEADAYVQHSQLRLWCQLIGQQVLSTQWLRSPSPAALQLSDALWSALLSSSSIPHGCLPQYRQWLLRLYVLCFGSKLSEVATAEQRLLSSQLHSSLTKAVKEREEERVGEGTGVEWRSCTYRKYLARQALVTQRAKRENAMGAAFPPPAHDGPHARQAEQDRKGKASKTGVIRLSKGVKGGEYRARETLVLDTADDEDEEWSSRDR